uniref:DUF7869 domain-containing protein n=1 Tax=Bombyx mori TaxID=7091 RepID=A0A8R2M6N9_BOMMO|nr:uncharacterized protein LOC119630407 [Bombyx mori]
MLSSRPYKDLDVHSDPSKKLHLDNFDTQLSPSALFTDISNKQHEKDFNIEPYGEDLHTLEWNSAESLFARPCLELNVLSASSQEMYTVGVATDNGSQPSTTVLLTDISKNFVRSTSFQNKGTDKFMSFEEDFSPSDEVYIPDTDEDATECEFVGKRQVTIPETSSSSIEDVENMIDNKETQLLNTNSSEIQSESSHYISTKTNSRKRTRNISDWKCNIRKQSILSGKAYTSKKGKFVPEKKIKPVCACRLKCNERISENVRTTIYQKYYAEDMTWDRKRQFIISRVSEAPTARSRRRDPDQLPKRAYTLHYTFLINEKVEKVCKKFFLNTLAISETVVRNAVKKSTNGFVQADRRGRHEPSNKIAEIVKETVRKHIDNVPKYESHYSRSRTERLYLGNHLNIDKLYSLYVEFCAEQNLPKENIAKAWLYRHIFNTEYNLGFNPPANDTCDDCDAFVIKLKNTTNETERDNIKAEHDIHLQESNLRYTLKGFDKVEAIESHGAKNILTVDLQKCLPTPYLTNSQSFYHRKLWTFNFTIMDSAPKESWCFMWDETVAGRGGNEMASGIVKFFEQTDDSALKEVTLWSDNCAGQNKNVYLMMAYFWILTQKEHLQIINHKYLLKGHTHMEVDVIHSIIEREKKKIQEFPIVTPWDWQQFIKSCSRNNKIKVINMETDHFKDFSAFCEGSSAPFVHRKKSNAGETVPYSGIVWMQFRKNEMGSMFYKTSFDQETFEQVSFIRNKRRAFSIPTPKPIRETRKPISKLKYNDLQKSLRWIPSMFHEYYKNLPCAEVPDLPEACE